MNAQPLVLSILGFSGMPGAGRVVLVNHGDKPIRVWRTGNLWGDTALWFEISRRSIVARVIRKPQRYTRNVPSSVVVQAGGSHTWQFDFGDGSWESDVPFEQMTGTGAEMAAIYEVSESPEALANGVWIGRLRSEPVKLGYVK